MIKFIMDLKIMKKKNLKKNLEKLFMIMKMMYLKKEV